MSGSDVPPSATVTPFRVGYHLGSLLGMLRCQDKRLTGSFSRKAMPDQRLRSDLA